MNNLTELLADYTDYFKYKKKLNAKTLKAYCIDLRQFQEFVHA